MNLHLKTIAACITLALASNSCILLPIAKRGDNKPGAENTTTTQADAPVQAVRPGTATTPRTTPRTAPATTQQGTPQSQGLRLPDMTGLPSERDLTRASDSDATSEDSGGIRARPPTE